MVMTWMVDVPPLVGALGQFKTKAKTLKAINILPDLVT